MFRWAVNERGVIALRIYGKKTIADRLEFLILKSESGCDPMLFTGSLQRIYQLGYSFSIS